jgi:hypothetical protein
VLPDSPMLTRDPSIAHPCRRPGRRSSRAARSGTRCSFEGRRLWRRSLTCLLAPLPVAFGPGRREAPFGGGRPAKQSEPARAPPISQTRRIVRGAQLPADLLACLPASLPWRERPPTSGRRVLYEVVLRLSCIPSPASSSCALLRPASRERVAGTGRGQPGQGRSRGARASSVLPARS